MPYSYTERTRLIEVSDEISALNRRILDRVGRGESETATPEERRRLDELLAELEDHHQHARQRLAEWEGKEAFQ